MTPRCRPVRVFVAYHDADLANEMANLLRAAGFDVDLATESVKVPNVHARKLTEVHVVDLDLLPDLDGIIYNCKHLQRSKLPGEVIVKITTAAYDDRAGQVMAAGAQFYLRKPVTPEVLVPRRPSRRCLPAVAATPHLSVVPPSSETAADRKFSLRT
jgi:DNA-binding response OmpR family regulator